MPSDAIKRVIAVTKRQKQFWSKSHGWAPDEAANILEKARLDRQISFAYTLHGYLAPFPPDAAEAYHIIGYTTLRSMCEGALKLFFSVYFEDYKKSKEAVYDKKKNIVPPKDLSFDKLIQMYAKHGDSAFKSFLERVQQRGNAIHHFADRNIGTQAELIEDIVGFEAFLHAVDCQIPYP